MDAHLILGLVLSAAIGLCLGLIEELARAKALAPDEVDSLKRIRPSHEDLMRANLYFKELGTRIYCRVTRAASRFRRITSESRIGLREENDRLMEALKEVMERADNREA